MAMRPALFGALFYLGLRLLAVTGAGLAFFVGKFLLALGLLALGLLALAAGITMRLWRGWR